MKSLIVIVGILLFILFIYFIINVSTLRQINVEHNKDLLESKSYNFAYYGAILFALVILCVAIYYGYNRNKGNDMFDFKLPSTQNSVDNIMKTLNNSGIQHHIPATDPISSVKK